MKQVWILNHYAQEPGGVGGTRHYSLATHLRALGWQASILASSVELNTGRQRLSKNESTLLQYFDGVPFLWVKTPTYKGNGASRLLNMLTYSMKVCFPWITRELRQPNLIVGSSVHPFAAVSAALLSMRYGVPFVFEVRDLWPQTLVDFGRLKDKSVVTRLLRWLELWLYRRADKIVVLMPKTVDYITPLGISADKVVWIPNGVELKDYLAPMPPVPRDVFTIMYFGAHGLANDLGCLLDAMAELNSRKYVQHIRLRLIGNGPSKADLIAQASRLNLRNVTFEDPVPKAKIPQLASEADAFVICVRDLPHLYKYGISMNKLFDYLAAARPIIISSAAANDPVREAGAGLTVAPEDSKELADAIYRLVNFSPEHRAAMGAAGRAYVEKNHSFSALAAKFAEVFHQLGK